MDHRFRVLHGKGIGAIRRQSEVISYSEELALWNSGVVGVRSPSALLDAVFFYNGLKFVLRGGEEHRELKISQFHFRDEVIDPENPDHMTSCLEYREHGSKNQPGGRHQLNLENKVVVQYERPELGERCHFYLLKLY